MVTRDAQIFGGADQTASKEFTAPKGEYLKVLDKTGGWYAIADPSGKTGRVMTGDVKPKTDMWDFDNGRIVKTESGYVYVYPGTKVAGTPEKPVPDNSSSLYKKMTEAAVKFRESYRDNQYIQVTGFTVKNGIPPSLDLTFGFK